MIYLQQVSFAYPSFPPVIESLSANFARGERVALVGANGAGKTTLLHLLAGIHQPTAGRIDLPTVGLVFQNPEEQFFHASVEEDVAFGPRNMRLPKEQIQKRVDEALQACDLLSLRKRHPMQLSAGEKRRVAIAGVLAMQPEVILLDEPTTALDGRQRRELKQTLQALPQTLILAGHDLDFLKQTTTRTLLLHGGKLHADGQTAEILNQVALLETLGIV
jgi:cobalt/nickel transport system ATP-binding protein